MRIILLLFLCLSNTLAKHLFEQCDKSIGLGWTQSDNNEWYNAIFTLEENGVDICMKEESSNDIIVMIRGIHKPKSKFKIEKVKEFFEKNYYYRDIKIDHNKDNDYIAYHIAGLAIFKKKSIVAEIYKLLIPSNSFWSCKLQFF